MESCRTASCDDGGREFAGGSQENAGGREKERRCLLPVGDSANKDEATAGWSSRRAKPRLPQPETSATALNRRERAKDERRGEFQRRGVAAEGGRD